MPSAANTSRDRTMLFAFSLVLLVGLGTIAFFKPYFTPQQWFTYRCILALAAGGFTAFLPGALDWQIAAGFRATGAIAMVVLVIYLGSRIESSTAQPRHWSLVVPANAEDAPSPDDAVVYVVVDNHVAAVSGTNQPAFPVSAPQLGRDILVERGSGGIVVHVPRAEAGQRFVMFVEDQDRWWKSAELLVPPTDAVKLDPTTIEKLRKRLP
jgi:hypothetical protein